jgi:hypothetical protein
LEVGGFESLVRKGQGYLRITERDNFRPRPTTHSIEDELVEMIVCP